MRASRVSASSSLGLSGAKGKDDGGASVSGLGMFSSNLSTAVGGQDQPNAGFGLPGDVLSDDGAQSSEEEGLPSLLSGLDSEGEASDNLPSDLSGLVPGVVVPLPAEDLINRAVTPLGNGTESNALDLTQTLDTTEGFPSSTSIFSALAAQPSTGGQNRSLEAFLKQSGQANSGAGPIDVSAMEASSEADLIIDNLRQLLAAGFQEEGAPGAPLRPPLNQPATSQPKPMTPLPPPMADMLVKSEAISSAQTVNMGLPLGPAASVAVQADINIYGNLIGAEGEVKENSTPEMGQESPAQSRPRKSSPPPLNYGSVLKSSRTSAQGFSFNSETQAQVTTRQQAEIDSLLRESLIQVAGREAIKNFSSVESGSLSSNTVVQEEIGAKLSRHGSREGGTQAAPLSEGLFDDKGIVLENASQSISRPIINRNNGRSDQKAVPLDSLPTDMPTLRKDAALTTAQKMRNTGLMGQFQGAEASSIQGESVSEQSPVSNLIAERAALHRINHSIRSQVLDLKGRGLDTLHSASIEVSDNGLGRLKINLELSGNKLHIQIPNASVEVQAVLDSNQSDLQQHLAKHEISLESFSTGGGDSDQKQGSEQKRQNPGGGRQLFGGHNPDAVAEENASIREHNGLINTVA